MNAGSFPPTDHVESKIFGFDFKRGLDHGETLTGASLTLSVIEGVDAAPSLRLIGPPAILGSQVRQRVAGLQVGASYRLMAAATTSAGSVKSLWGRIECMR